MLIDALTDTQQSIAQPVTTISEEFFHKPTLSEVFDAYCRTRKPKANTVATYKCWYNHHLLQFASKTLDEITVPAIEFHFGISSNIAPTAANQAYRLLGYLYRFASVYFPIYANTLAPSRFLSACKAWNPQVPEAHAVEDLASWNDSRDEFLTCAAERDLMLVLLLSGLRFTELARLRVEDVDIEENTIRVFLKQSRWHTMPLGVFAGRIVRRRIFRGLPGAHGGFVFTDDEGSPFLVSSAFYRKMKTAEKFSFHSLRRTWMRCGLLDCRIQEIEMKLLCGHSAGSNMTQRYSAGAVEQLRPAMQEIENRLLTKLGLLL